jgi:hypothetical protein
MSKYSYSENAGEISGFGGGYEKSCRKMVVAGMEWIDEHPGCTLDYKEYKNIYGITADETPDLLDMQKHMNAAIGNGASGAMMQACTGHIMYAHKNGWDKYMEEMTARMPT